MRPNTYCRPFFSLLLCAFMLLPAGCGNDEYADVIDESNGERIPIDITLSGIRTLFGPYGEEARNVQYNKIHETRDLDKNHMLETLVMAEPDTLRPPLTRATSALTNTTLRLVAYDNSGAYAGTGVYNIDGSGQVTSTDKLFLTKSGSYTFHCFSPAMDIAVNEDNTVTVDLPAAGGITGSAFYYAKTGNYSVTIKTTGDNITTITVPTLAPKSCKLVLDIQHSSGITASFTDAVVSATLSTNDAFTLPGGTFTSSTTTVPVTLTTGEPVVYAFPGTISDLSVAVHSLNVEGADQGDVTFSFPGSISMTAGNAYKASVNYTAPNWIKIAELPFKMARGNLLYNSTTGRWYMAPDQGYYCPKQNGGYETLTTNNDYGSSGDKVYSYINWGTHASNPNFSITSSGPLADAWGGSTAGTHYGTKFGYNSTSATSAGTDVSNYKNNNDPCYAALGGGWHLPTGGNANADMGYFTKASNTSSTQKYQTYTTKSNLSSGTTRTVYGHYFGTTGQPTVAQQDQYVFLPAAGYRYYGPTGAIYTEGSTGDGGYWSSTPRASNTLSAYFLFFSSSTVLNGTSSNNLYNGRSVRCVNNQ